MPKTPDATEAERQERVQPIEEQIREHIEGAGAERRERQEKDSK
jgi:hypothetical protein